MALKSSLRALLEEARKNIGVDAFQEAARRGAAAASEQLQVVPREACERLLAALKEEGGLEIILPPNTHAEGNRPLSTITLLESFKAAILDQVDANDMDRYIRYVLTPLRAVQVG